MNPDSTSAARVVAGCCSALIPGLFVFAAACSDGTGLSKAAVDNLADVAGLSISAPVPAPASDGQSPLAALSSDASVVYVSLAPGSVPTGVQTTIDNVASGQSLTAEVSGGGFDPVAIPASVGDTIIVRIRDIAANVIHAVRVIARRRPPVIVRTDPPPKKRDVPLNTIIVMVFSTPIDERTVTPGSVQLWRGATRVPGTVRFVDVAHLRAEFHPDVLLGAQTDYRLVVSQGIRDVNGVALDSVVTIPFTTGTTASATNLVFASVTAGLSHTCGVTTAGAAFCWGDNDRGALGDGTTASSTTPVPVAGGLTFAVVSAMYYHSCGVTTSGNVYCWGKGPIGTPTPGDGLVPQLIAGGSNFATVSVGPFHACALTRAGRAYCWGSSGMGGLGNGAVDGSSVPVPVAGGLVFASVSAGGGSSCGVTFTGAAYCWGSNMLAALGTGASTGPEVCQATAFNACSTVPVAVAGGLTFRQLNAKNGAACGITTSETAYCWGSNLNDALGFGTKTGPEQCAWDESYMFPCSRVPYVVPAVPNLVYLSDADTYSCGLTSTGVAYCWGYPQSIGDLLSNTGPVAVPGGLTFATLSAGPYSTCGVTGAGVAYCWGANDTGQLGDGTTTPTGVPVKVAGQP